MENKSKQESSKLVEILEHFIAIFNSDNPAKRKTVVKEAAITLLGVGLIAGVDYLLEKKTKQIEEIKKTNKNE